MVIHVANMNCINAGNSGTLSAEKAAISALERSHDIVTPQKLTLETIIYKLYELPNEFWHHKTVRRLSESININKEYDLIMAKKSKLSAWERAEVIHIKEARYEN